MSERKSTIAGAVCLLFLAGCISTTTGSVTEPVADDEGAADLNYQLGARYYRQGSYELARDRLQQAINFDPDMAVAHTTLALTYEALDNPRLARESYEAAVKASPRDFAVQNTYAVFLCRELDFEQAQKYFDRAASHPQNDNAEVTLTNAGVCMSRKPDLELSESYYRQALERKTNYAEALLQLCLLKFANDDFLSARAFLQRYLAGNVPTAGVLYLASRIEDQLGNDRGRTDYEDQLLRQFPTSPEARKVLGSS